MKIKIFVEVEVERVSGLFASKEEITEAIISEIENANPGSISGVGANGDSEYEITDFNVSEVTK